MTAENDFGMPAHLTREGLYSTLSMSDVQAMETFLFRNGFSLAGQKAVLDFACGNGRMTRHVRESNPDAEIYGCDTNPDLIADNSRRMSSIRFFVCSPIPPLPLPDESLDFIFSFSIFTHLTEANHAAWLREMGRILKPGGIMLHSFHGHDCLRQLRTFNPGALDKYNIEGSLEAFMSRPESYSFSPAHENTPEYGYTIISEGYVRARWEEYSGTKLLACHDGVVERPPEGNHGFALLGKPARQPPPPWE